MTFLECFRGFSSAGISANQASFGSGQPKVLSKGSSKGLVLHIYIYIYIDYSLGRPNPRLGETERLAVPNESSRPEAAFSNVFSSASPCRTSFFQRLAVPKELFRACSRREGALRVPRATLERLGSVLERPWSVKRAPRNLWSALGESWSVPGASKERPETHKASI